MLPASYPGLAYLYKELTEKAESDGPRNYLIHAPLKQILSVLFSVEINI